MRGWSTTVVYDSVKTTLSAPSERGDAVTKEMDCAGEMMKANKRFDIKMCSIRLAPTIKGHTDETAQFTCTFRIDLLEPFVATATE